MTTVLSLLDLARDKCGSTAELGRRTGFSGAQLADFRSGKKQISPETAALLCEVLQLSGEEAREWTAVAMIENPKNERIADRLRAALFGRWVRGVATQLNRTDATVVIDEVKRGSDWIDQFRTPARRYTVAMV